MSQKKYIHEIHGMGLIYSNRKKAQGLIAKAMGKNPETFIPTKTEIKEGKLIFHYPNGWKIVRREIL